MPSEKQIEAAADQISEGLGAFLRKFCDSEASKRARYYLHEMPEDEWNQMALMLATEALTAAEQAEPAPAALADCEERQQAKIESVLLDAVRKIVSMDLSGCANMTTAEIFGALSRMHETARVTAERFMKENGNGE